tara:strand:- start:1289 stop:1492 length:204 start_codon:yes stop_codon:yes gene_type:complete
MRVTQAFIATYIEERRQIEPVKPLTNFEDGASISVVDQLTKSGVAVINRGLFQIAWFIERRLMNRLM